LLNPQNGIVNQALDTVFGFKFNALSLGGMIFVEGIRMVPITFLLVSGTFRSMNGSLEDAAAMSGAPLHTTLRRVTLPLLAPALLAALIYNFVSVLEELDVPLVLGLRGHVNVLSTEVYLSVNPAGGLPNFGLASTYGLLLMVLSVIPLIIYRRLMKRVGSFATTTGRGYQSRRLALGKWRYPALAIFMVYIFVTFILPLLVMLFASVEPYFSGVSVAAFHRMTLSGWTAELHSTTLVSTILNTLKICVLVAFFVMLFSFIASWLIVRSRRGSASLDFWVFFPHLIPAVVMGLAIALVYLVLPVGVYDTIWIIVIALFTKFIALGTRITTPGIAQIGTSLEEAVAASGGGLRHVWGRVLLPLLRPVLTNGFVLVFVVAAQSLTLPLLLAAPGSEVLATSIWGYWQLGHVVPAMVDSTLLTVITVILATAMRTGDANAAGSRKSRRQARRATVAVDSTPSMSTVAATSPEFSIEP
jgi:iron(III) transport system permease protein